MFVFDCSFLGDFFLVVLFSGLWGFGGSLGLGFVLILGWVGDDVFLFIIIVIFKFCWLFFKLIFRGEIFILVFDSEILLFLVCCFSILFLGIYF